MFGRFTERARRAIVLAQAEARMLEHDWIGTEHLLLGLLHEDQGVAARALESMGISLDAMRVAVEGAIGRGERPLPESGHIPFTPRSKKVLELSLREARELGHRYIGTEHILLALLREGDGVAAQVLVRAGVSLDRARQQVTELLSGRAEDVPRFVAEPTEGDRLVRRLASIAARLDAIEPRLRPPES